MSSSHVHAVQQLRESVAPVLTHAVPALPFGIVELDDRLSGSGLHGAALHELAPATPTLGDEAAATLFLAGMASRFARAGSARVLWAVTRFDLYAPGLEQAGLGPDQVLFAEARDDAQVLALMEDGLRHGGLAAVVGETRRADMTATRRLQLAAADGRTPALLFRRWRRQAACPLTAMSAAMTRWRIACAPSAALPTRGVGRARWQVELVRQRNGAPFSLLVEACDDQGRLALPAPARDRAPAAARATARAA